MRIIELPHSTSFTTSGPIVEMRKANVIVRYDHEDDKRQVSWTKITLGSVYGYKYTEGEYIDTLDYEFGLVEITDSKWIQEMLNVWGGEKERAFGSEPDKVHHYRLYFDDYGLHEVICKTIKIEEEK